MAGVLPATLRVASRSKIAPGDFVARTSMCSALTASNRFASWLKFAPDEFVILGALPVTLRVALRSKIVLCSASCLAKNPAFAIHGYGVRRAEAVLRLFPPHPGNFPPLGPLALS